MVTLGQSSHYWIQHSEVTKLHKFACGQCQDYDTTLHDDCCGKLQKDLDKLNKLSHYWKDEFYAKKMQCPRDEGE